MRAFIAVPLAPDLRQRLAAIQDELRGHLNRPDGPRIKITWVKPEALHLTIKFLGEIQNAAVVPLREALGSIGAGRLSYEMPLARVGAFPRPQASRAIWIGPPANWESSAEGRSLVALVREIDTTCAAIGVVEEKNDWRPHLTLARVRDGERAAGQTLVASGVFERDWEVPALGIRAISLIKSELLPEGPRHTELWTVT